MKFDTLWRVSRAPYADLAGEGARRYGGRWNPVGVPVVYTSGSASLAALEALVHTEIDTAPADLVLVEVSVAGLSWEEVADGDLPPAWRAETAGAATQLFGERWVREARSALLLVPPAILAPGVPDRNVLFNPAHPEAEGARIRVTMPFRFDGRLFR